MIHEFELTNFRAIKKAKLQNLSKINIFVGKVNTGKTSILEALYLYLSGHPNAITDLVSFREIMSDDDCFKGLFYNHKTENEITLKGNINKKMQIAFNTNQQNILLESNGSSVKIDSITLKYSSHNVFKTIHITRKTHHSAHIEFQHEITAQESFSNNNAEFIYEKQSYQEKLIDNLKNILTNIQKKNSIKDYLSNFSQHIQDIDLIGNTIMIQKDNLDHLINLKLMGAGFRKYLFILLAILNNKQYIFIDEIENGLHFEDIEQLFSLILDSMPNIQFFITTHNKEILFHLSQLLQQKEDNERKLSLFNVYEDKKGDTDIQEYPQESFIFNMKKNNEMRG